MNLLLLFCLFFVSLIFTPADVNTCWPFNFRPTRRGFKGGRRVARRIKVVSCHRNINLCGHQRCVISRNLIEISPDTKLLSVCLNHSIPTKLTEISPDTKLSSVCLNYSIPTRITHQRTNRKKRHSVNSASIITIPNASSIPHKSVPSMNLYTLNCRSVKKKRQ